MRYILKVLLAGGLLLCATGTANAQFFKNLTNKVKDAVADVGMDSVQEAIGINLPCQVDTNSTDALSYCLQNSLSESISKNFSGLLSGEDMSTHQSTLMDTIFSGEGQAWKNPATGASGQTKIVSEKTKTKKTKVVVLKDKVETVPQMTLIGENYQAASSVNVRGGPGTDYKIVGSLASGDVVNVVGKVKEGNWYMVSQGGVGSGFVFKDLLTPAATLEATHTAQPEGDLEEVKTKVTKTCKTIEQKVVGDDGTEKVEKIKACQGPNGWEIV